MVSSSFDKSCFALQIAAYPNKTFSVISFKNLFEPNSWVGLDTLYQFSIRVKNNADLPINDLLGKSACLQILIAHASNYFHGIITQLVQTENNDIEILLTSPFYPLTQNSVNRSYVNFTLAEIFAMLLTRNGWRTADYRFSFKKFLNKHPFIVQYNETDYEFLQRLIRHYGFFYRFKQDLNGYCLIVVDSFDDDVPISTLPFIAQTGTDRKKSSIFHANICYHTFPKQTILRGYNTDQPTTLLQTTLNSKLSTNSGVYYQAWGGYNEQQTGNVLNQNALEELESRSKVLTAMSDDATLQVGQQITISEHPLSIINNNYRIITIQHYGNQNAGYGQAQDKPRYYNIMQLIPAERAYRPTLQRHKQYYNYFIATIETISDVAIYLDDEGAYHLRTNFDASDAPASLASAPTRLSQPLSGNKTGFHFPLRNGTQVLIACIHGDLNFPIILGILPDAAQQSPVTQSNAKQHILSSAAGHQLTMDDSIESPRLQLHTPGANNRLLLSAQPEQIQALLESKKGNVTVEAAKNILIQTTQNYQQHVGRNHQVSVKQNYQANAKSSDLTLTAGQNLQQFAHKNDLTFHTQEGSLIDTVGGNAIFSVGKDANFVAQEGSIQLTNQQGSLYGKITEALNIQGVAQGNILLRNNNSHLLIKSDGSIEIQGKVMNVVGINIDLATSQMQHYEKS